MKKILVSLLVLAGAFAISSCVKEEVKEPRIIKNCVGLVCSFAIEDDTLQRFTNIIGKSTDRVVKRTQLRGAEDQVVWTVPDDGREANNTQLMIRNLTLCPEEDCTLSSNPTGWVFASTDPRTVIVSGVIVNPDGSTREISKEVQVDLEIAPPIVTITKDNPGELNYTFEADSTDTGIPDGATYTWFVDGDEVGEGDTIAYEFPVAATSHEVKLIVSSPDMGDDLEVVNTIVSGTIPPAIEKNTVDGKRITLTADATATGLPAGTVFTWSVSGQPSITATGSTVTLELPEYNTSYDISVKSTAPGAASGIQSQPLSVKTGFGIPTIEKQAIGGSGTDYNLTVNLDGTGILASQVAFAWKFDGVLSSETGQTAEHEFGTAGNHTIELTVTPTGADPIVMPVQNITIGAPDIPNLDYQVDSTNPRFVTVTADLLDTGIDSTWTRTWDFGDGTIITDQDSVTHEFALTSTQHTVTFTATKNGLTRTATETVTTGDATIPLSFSISPNLSDSSGLTYRIDTSTSEFQNSGITSAWNLNWSSTPAATFSPSTSKIGSYVDVTFSQYNTSHTITLNATPPAGSGIPTPSPASTSITTGQQPILYPSAITLLLGGWKTGWSWVGQQNQKITSQGYLSDTGLKSAIINNNMTVTFTCEDGYYISDKFSGEATEFKFDNNIGPNNERPTKALRLYSIAGNSAHLLQDTVVPNIIYQRGSPSVNISATQLGCWKLNT